MRDVISREAALAALLEEVMEGRLPNHRAELMAELDRLAGRER